MSKCVVIEFFYYAEFWEGKLKTNWIHFLSFLNHEIAQTSEILPCGSQGPVYFGSKLWLLLTWFVQNNPVSALRVLKETIIVFISLHCHLGLSVRPAFSGYARHKLIYMCKQYTNMRIPLAITHYSGWNSISITMAVLWAIIQVSSTPICMVQCTHLITTGGTPDLYNRGSSMLVNSLHSGENYM